jgi:hypothetical protein
MKDFFLKLLQELDKLTGIKQWDRLASIESVDLRKKEINDLLEILNQTSALFPLIPKDAQKSIIRHAVLSDGDFIGLNAKFVYRSLAAHKDKYFKEVAHIPTEQDPNWKPLEGEARQEKLQLWLKSLEGFADKIETKSHVRELEASLPPKDKGIIYLSTGIEDIFAKQMHIQYIRENFDKDGKPLPGYLTEKEWNEKQK